MEKAAVTKKPRFMLRVLRVLPNTRRKLNTSVLRRLVHGFYTHSAAERDALMKFVDEVSAAYSEKTSSLKFFS